MATEPAIEHKHSVLEAPINFLVPSGDKPRVNIPDQGRGLTERSGHFQKLSVPIQDGRGAADAFTLDRNGFEFHRHQSDVVDFLDEGQVVAIYYPEIEELVKRATGGSKVHVFDHTIRIEDDGKRDAQAVRAPVEVAHNDYTDISGPQRVRDLFEPEEAQRWLSRRYAVINVWRSIGPPAVTTPLAISDAHSMAPEDFIATDLVYKDRVGEISQIAHNDAQRWFYFSNMVRDEALLIKCFDSETDGRARFSAHTAFTNPQAPKDAPPRESIEVRTLVSF
ncbi:MAG: CmcJ/NvfI family oxidoreductase [Proteobacteria bacterium]|nr:CmcJ/NvfI family oxidoreductase [Pseudomonadota bacterium]